MSRLPSIVFLLLYLVATTELHQLFQARQELVHEHNHQVESPGIGLSHFIASNSGARELTDTEPTQHQKLPIKHDKCTEVFIAVAMPPNDDPAASVHRFAHTIDKFKRESCRRVSSFHLSIWQPPRI